MYVSILQIQINGSLICINYRRTHFLNFLYLDYSNVFWWLKLEKINSYNLLRKGSHFKWLSKEEVMELLIISTSDSLPLTHFLWRIYTNTITMYQLRTETSHKRVEVLCPFTVILLHGLMLEFFFSVLSKRISLIQIIQSIL